MDHLAIGADGGAPDAAVRVPQLVRRAGGNGAALQGLVVQRLDIVHLETDVFHAVAVQQQKQLTRIVVFERRGEHQPDTALLQDVGGAVGMAGFRAEIGDLIKPQDLAIEERRLQGVAGKKLYVVYPLHRQGFLHGSPPSHFVVNVSRPTVFTGGKTSCQVRYYP